MGSRPSANGALGYLHLAWEWTIRGVLPCGGLFSYLDCSIYFTNWGVLPCGGLLGVGVID